MNIFEQMVEVFEIIETQSTRTFIYVDDEHSALKNLLKIFWKIKKSINIGISYEIQKFVEDRNMTSVIIPFREALEKNNRKNCGSILGKAIFFSDHHHIYQPEGMM